MLILPERAEKVGIRKGAKYCSRFMAGEAEMKMRIRALGCRRRLFMIILEIFATRKTVPVLTPRDDMPGGPKAGLINETLRLDPVESCPVYP